MKMKTLPRAMVVAAALTGMAIPAAAQPLDSTLSTENGFGIAVTQLDVPTPTDPVDPAPSTPSDPVDPAPENPSDPVDPTPEVPADPVDPAPENPSDPVNPVDPDPSDPVDPTPGEPEDPTPVDPVDPAPADPGMSVPSPGTSVPTPQLPTEPNPLPQTPLVPETPKTNTGWMGQLTPSKPQTASPGSVVASPAFRQMVTQTQQAQAALLAQNAANEVAGVPMLAKTGVETQTLTLVFTTLLSVGSALVFSQTAYGRRFLNGKQGK
ncbi:MAG: hypothetical protein WBH73_08805 [Arcanobacterium sp.]